MKYPKNEKGMYVLGIWDQEDLHYVAEDVITGLRFNRCHFDDEGNYIAHELSKEERLARHETMFENAKTDYLNFLENEELRQIRFSSALEMPLEKIKQKYLKDVLPVARGILQKDTTDFGDPFVVSGEVPDSFLDDLLALRWRENLKLWTIRWDKEKREAREKGQADAGSDMDLLTDEYYLDNEKDYPINENRMCVLSIWDQEELHNVAEEVIVGLRHERWQFDGEGNNIAFGLPSEEKEALIKEFFENEKPNYLDPRENEELRQISFSDALRMPLEEIKEKYLKDVLPVARGILRKDTMDFGHRFVVSEAVPDSYLDDLLALRWRENLKLWTMQWDMEKEKNREEETDDRSDG